MNKFLSVILGIMLISLMALITLMIIVHDLVFKIDSKSEVKEKVHNDCKIYAFERFK